MLYSRGEMYLWGDILNNTKDFAKPKKGFVI